MNTNVAARTQRVAPSENEIAKEIVDAAFHMHQQLGPGLLESVYEVNLAHELRKRGLNVLRQVPFRLCGTICNSTKDIESIEL